LFLVSEFRIWSTTVPVQSATLRGRGSSPNDGRLAQREMGLMAALADRSREPWRTMARELDLQGAHLRQPAARPQWVGGDADGLGGDRWLPRRWRSSVRTNTTLGDGAVVPGR
jgi:hypothetical protein